MSFTLRKSIICIISMLILVALGVWIYFTLPFKDKTELEFTILQNQLVLEVDQSGRVGYSLNCSDASLSLKVQDNNIAECTFDNQAILIIALSEGKTEVNIVARLNGQVVERSIEIQVEKEESIAPSIDPPDKQEEEARFKISGINCVIDDNIITMQAGRCFISIEENIDDKSKISFESDLLIKETKLSGFTYSIEADSVGEYDLAIIINNKLQNFIVVVI